MNALVFIAVVLLAVSASAQNTMNGRPVVYGYRSGQKCPAQLFYNDCNGCSCQPSGYDADCIRIGCLGLGPGTALKPQYAPGQYINGNRCPAPYFYDGCNTCRCNRNGVTAACTRKFCLSQNSL